MEKEQARCVVCLGFFDGVHRGHLALIRAADAIREREGLPVCVHTFDHAPGDKGPALTDLAEREKLLREAGADRVAVSAFDESMRTMSGEDFFHRVVLDRLHAAHVVCGDDHRFGYKGAWGVRELQRMCEKNGVSLTVVPPVTLKDGQRISSSAIRNALSCGNISLAEEMLGRPIDEKLKKSFQL